MDKKKIIKIVLLILLIALVLFVANIIRKMIIIKDINEKVSKYMNNDNHYEKIVSDYGESKTTTDYYCKGDKAVMFLKTTTNKTEEEKKLTQYFNGEKCNSYIEAGTTKIAMLNSNGIPSKVLVWGIDYDNNFWNLFYLALTTPIKSVEYNGKECYLLDSPVCRNAYIEKETGLTLKAIDGQIDDALGNKQDIVVEYEYNFNDVDDSIFTEPDITEYEVKQN